MNKPISSNREIAAHGLALLARGWVVVRTSGPHTVIQAPNGLRTSVPRSPSDHRAVLNFIHQTKRMEVKP